MQTTLALYVLLIGGVIVLSLLIRAVFARYSLPPLVGYFILGFLIRWIDSGTNLLAEQGYQVFELLAELGIIVLLFRIGLESNVRHLMRRLPQATVVTVGNILVNGFLGYAVAHYLLDLNVIPSLFVAVALIPTSVGITTAIWDEADALDSPVGDLLLDVAEMDDITGILLMALLFSIAPLLQAGQSLNLGAVLLETFGWFALKLVLFSIVCLLFARYLERPMTMFFGRIRVGQEAMLGIAGIGMIVAAAAELLGFSVAIGAFFAGLIFSRDPEAVKFEASFQSLHDMFAPFFFVGIGLKVDPSVVSAATLPALVLLLTAVSGKVIGNAGPAAWMVGGSAASLLGISMVPRAEIALIIMQRGLSLGEWAVSPTLFAEMVLVSAVTALTIPIVVHLLFTRGPKINLYLEHE